MNKKLIFTIIILSNFNNIFTAELLLHKLEKLEQLINEIKSTKGGLQAETIQKFEEDKKKGFELATKAKNEMQNILNQEDFIKQQNYNENEELLHLKQLEEPYIKFFKELWLYIKKINKKIVKMKDILYWRRKQEELRREEIQPLQKEAQQIREEELRRAELTDNIDELDLSLETIRVLSKRKGIYLNISLDIAKIQENLKSISNKIKKNFFNFEDINKEIEDIKLKIDKLYQIYEKEKEELREELTDNIADLNHSLETIRVLSKGEGLSLNISLDIEQIKNNLNSISNTIKDKENFLNYEDINKEIKNIELKIESLYQIYELKKEELKREELKKEELKREELKREELKRELIAYAEKKIRDQLTEERTKLADVQNQINKSRPVTKKQLERQNRTRLAEAQERSWWNRLTSPQAIKRGATRGATLGLRALGGLSNFWQPGQSLFKTHPYRY